MGTQSLPDRADVVIVGGGIVGTSTAFFLATETQLDVALLERDNIASGSTGDSSAILRHHYGPQEIYTRMAAWSHEFYREFEEHTGEPIAYEPNPLVRLGREDTPAGRYARKGFDVLSSLGIPVSEYDRDALAEAFSMLSLGDVEFGIVDETAAYSDGADAAGGFARAAAEHGATVLTGITVDDFLVEEGAITGVTTDAGTVHTGKVVVAAGPWTPELLAPLGVEIPVTLTREEVLLLEPGEGLDQGAVGQIPTTAPPGGDWYVRSDFGDGVLIATHHTGKTVGPDAPTGTVEESTVLELTESLVEFVPELADAGLRGSYGGIYSNTPDHDFVIDRVGPDGCHVACGFSGHGFKHGPVVGKALSDLVAAGSTDAFDVEFFSLDRFEDDPAGHGKPADSI
ncbi:Glycine/D-amino acid oxidase (deaminating) [Halalkaliarchaeum sp. AArc-CO]|uniref:NAD(P)/FAD-dependent oxidoreductase n=1 Tax=unclassified Halalkaliarchaeum TaxID=2678344 RepID=UPI00217E521E|nr:MULTISPECIES: FAD-binding oxidoreductase [unclassified Halalkaliarchaeum]MDR5673775.1 FAD-binding oxidoreductase [Halalkaliarchaeum sp. AArc-GB]UWG51013.1 Glycine/D-amino acid oxidase (deaminating) [Halalkaliarchaeum sp. AArc-CO]